MVTTKQKIAGAFGVGVLAKSPAARRALVGILRQGGRTMGPWGLAAWLAYEGYIRRDQIRSTANEIAERLPGPVGGQGGDPTFGERSITFGVPSAEGTGFAEFFSGPRGAGPFERMGRKARRVKKAKSKYQKAVSKAYKAVKKHSKRLTPKAAFTKAAKIASKANPVTRSKIGKGKSFAQKTARKIRQSVWNVRKRLKR